MALITCSECGKEISDKATGCPHCGNPVKTEMSDAMQTKAVHTGSEKTLGETAPKSYLKKAVLLWGLLIVDIIILIGLVTAIVCFDVSISDNVGEYTIVGLLALNIIFAIQLSVKIGKSMHESIKSKHVPVKNIIAIILSIGFILVNCTVMHGRFADKTSIVGMWESDFLEGYSTRYVFDKNGNFNSYVIEDSSGILVPGGTGTYIIESNEVVITISGGEVIRDEYKIDGERLELIGLTWERID